MLIFRNKADNLENDRLHEKKEHKDNGIPEVKIQKGEQIIYVNNRLGNRLFMQIIGWGYNTEVVNIYLLQV